MIEAEHGLDSNLLLYLGHIFEACLFDILSQKSIGIDGEEFGSEFSVYCGVELYFKASASFPL